MPTPVSYLSGNTLSYQSGMVKKGTVGLNLTSSLTGNYRWWNGVEATASQYLIYSDTYTTGASNEANVTPAAWSTPDLTDQSLLNLINTLPDRIGQTAFTTLSNALIWLNQSGKYFLVKNGYENLVTSGLTLNLDAGWTNSYSGTTSWRDISGNGKTGTLTNGPAFNSGNTGSIYFDGTDDFCVVPSSSLNGLSSGSISVWVKFLNLNFQYVLSLPNSSGNNGFDILIENGKLDSYLQALNSAGSTGSQFVPKLGIWYNIVTTYDGTTHKLFVNGILISSVGRSGTIQNGIGQTFLGRFSSGFGAYSNNYTSNAQLYNRALSQTEILQNYQLYKNRFGYDVVENGLVLNLNSQNYVSYRETGTSWFDLTGNNNTGTLTNGPTFNTTERSIVFDGTDDYVDCGNNSNLNFTTNFSIGTWMNANDIQASVDSGILGKITVNDGYQGYMLWFTNNKNVVLYIRGNYINSTFSLNSNTWYYVVGTYNGTTASLYINGILNASTNVSVIANATASNFWVGRYEFTSGSRNFTGKIASAQLYNRTLSATEILQNYYQGNIVTNGLVLNLDAGNLISYGGTGTSWKDLTNTTTGATLTNGPTYNTSNGGSIVFDGTNDYGIINNVSELNPASLTECIWVKFNRITGTVQQFTSKYYGSSTLESYALWYFPSWNGWQASLVSNTGVAQHLNYNLTPTLGQWYHFAHTFDNSSKSHKMYLNGELVNSSTFNYTLGYDSGPYTLGAEYENGVMSFWHDGAIAISQLYNRALSQSEIIQNFNAHKSRYGL